MGGDLSNIDVICRDMDRDAAHLFGNKLCFLAGPQIQCGLDQPQYKPRVQSFHFFAPSAMKTSAQIREIADDIEKIVRENDLAVANPSAIRQLEFQYGLMRAHCHYCAEKAGKIATLGKTFYSARKHQKHPRGAEGVLREMHMNLDSIRSWAEVWEDKGN
ncbi:hypothetical protein [Pandoraea anapnoica]|uniref:hypothetical protein n=1 Tax=Pandoraea anapnoica TaxID=2508301 RepID=UPI001FEA7A83|nr:hypothetical protein [Pandoraea anapnoica]